MTVSIAEEMNPTRRNTMEDVHAFHGPSSWNCPDENAIFIGVYDGHGGRSIVDYLEDHLVENVAKEWCFSCEEEENRDENSIGNKKRRLDENISEEIVESAANQKVEKQDEGQIIRTALERSFLLTDVQSRMAGINTSGATVACCVVVPKFVAGTLDSISIHCANAGDARIVLSSCTARLPTDSTTLSSKKDLPDTVSKSALRLTHDHKATDVEEQTRIKSSGGMMLRNRVLGVLAVARSLGDHGLKEFVIGRPYLSSTVVSIEKSEACSKTTTSERDKDLPLTDGEFLIAACDGLWDVMEDQEAVDLVRNSVNDSSSCKIEQEKVARYLIDEALRRGSNDNITVIVYWL